MQSLSSVLTSRYTIIVSTLIAFGLAGAPKVVAQDAAAKGLEVATRSDATDRGFGTSEATLTMVLRNASGQKTTRNLRLLTLERQTARLGDMTISVFQSPADVKGTALLSHAKVSANDDQWLYLPALKRVKRISSANKSGPFLGSEFAYEDFTAQELNKFTYTWLREESCDGRKCDVIERIPTYKNSGYSKQVVWIDRKDFQFRKIDFYDRAGNNVKQMVFENYKKINGFWRAHRLAVRNLRNGKSTELLFSDFKFGTGLTVADFQPTVLERLR